MIRYNKNENWFEMWFSDKKCMIAIMYSNLMSDLNAGYNPIGDIIKNQKAMIANYEKQLEKQLEKFASMTDENVNKWCFYDMKNRGVIE